jgi:F0F1-type ATP synthase assembly protein I
MRKRKLFMIWVHFTLAVLSLVAAVDILMKAMEWAVPFSLPDYAAVLPVSVSMLLRSVAEFQETEKEFIELRNE